MPICQKAKDEAEEVMAVIDKLQAHIRSGDEELLYQLTEDLRDTMIIQREEIRRDMSLILPRSKIPADEKLKTGKWKECEFCNAIVKDMKEHHKTKRCRQKQTNEDEEYYEMEDKDEISCGFCGETLTEDLNMGACMCGAHTTICQDCGKWSETEQEWLCGKGKCVSNEE